MNIYSLEDKIDFLYEVATLEYEEWAKNVELNKNERINNKIDKIKNLFSNKKFCKLIALKDNELVGFISIFPYDCDEEPNLTPWYATMYVKEKYRGKGYSKILNDAILKEANKRGFDVLYLKTNLENYYEKFGAEYIKELSNGEKLYQIKTRQ